MKSIAAVLISLFLLGACTKQSSSKKPDQVQYLNYNSKIKYQFKNLEKFEDAAMVEGTPVSWSQLLSNDVALQELQGTYFKKGTEVAISWAAEQASEGPVTLTVFGPQPEPAAMEAMMAVAGSNVTVEFKDPTDHTTLAKIGEKTLLWKDFQTSSMAHSKLYARLFQQRMQRLNGIVVRRFLLQASKDAKIGMEDFVKTKILQGEFNPTQADVKEFAIGRGISEGDLNEIMMERLTEIVKQNHRDQKIEDYVAKELIKNPIEVAFNSPKIRVETPEITETMPQWGEEKGPELVFVGHWSCDNCGDSVNTFLKTKENFEKVMQGAFIYSFPDRDREARMGAEAALCVKEQNQTSFWTFLAKIIDVKADNAEEKINLAAQGSGVDYDQFRDCFLKRQHQEVVNGHLAYAKKLGITSAPLMILQGDVLEAPIDMDTISAKIEGLGITTKANKKMGFFARILGFFGL